MLKPESYSDRCEPKNIRKYIPVVHKIVMISVDLHHFVNRNDPKGYEKDKCYYIVPIVVAIQGLFSVIDGFL